MSGNVGRHQAKKRFGQNFLTDKNLLNKIVQEADVKDKDVIEIGPGMGALTNFLVKEAKTLTAYEVDLDLKKYLDEIKAENDNFKVIYEDILKIDIDDTKEYHVVANIPYNITSPIIFKILETKNIKSATLMVQKEVCDRIAAIPNTKDYNALTLIVNYYMNVEKIVNVNKKMFKPVPKVDSAVFKMERRVLKTNKSEEDLFISIVKASFHQKRKTLANNLAFSFNIKKDLINTFLTKLDIDLKQRAESINLDKFLEITKKWEF